MTTKSLWRYLLVFGIPLAVSALYWALPCYVDPVEFRYSEKPFPEFKGPLAVNEELKKAQKLFENEVVGPEAFAMDTKGRVYTGLVGGRIIRLADDFNSYTTVARAGKPPYDDCEDLSRESEERCGRILGIDFHKDRHNELYAIDSSNGLLKVNVDTGEVELLAPSGKQGDKHVPFSNFLNDVVVLRNGSVYFTDSSKKFSRRQNRMEAVECRANGQLLHYNPADRSVSIVLDKLHFPNGICIGGNEESVLISETTRARILRYHIESGEVDVFAENLPGLPDNISPSASGGYWVAIAFPRQFKLFDSLTEWPSVRTFIAKLHLVSLVVYMTPAHGLLVELDSNGHVLRSFHDRGGHKTAATSHVLDLGGSLLIGSYYAPYLLKLDLL